MPPRRESAPGIPHILKSEAPTVKLLWLWLLPQGVVSHSQRAMAEALGFDVSTLGVALRRLRELELVEDLIVAGLGVALLPRHRRTGRGVRVLPLADPVVSLRAYAVTRRGRDAWPPLRAVLERPAHRGAGAGAGALGVPDAHALRDRGPDAVRVPVALTVPGPHDADAEPDLPWAGPSPAEWARRMGCAEDVARMAELGLRASVQPAHLHPQRGGVVVVLGA